MRDRPIVLAIVLLLLVSTLAAVPPSGAEEGDRWGPGLPTYRYTVVAPEDWKGIVDPLIEWRNVTSSRKITFIPLERAMVEGTGHDGAARLKDTLRRTGLSYNDILLVGDADVIPVRRVFTDILQDGNVSDPLNFRWTDDYYLVGMEEDWDQDGDGIYGEDGEVLGTIAPMYRFLGGSSGSVGRIPASTELELERFVDKLLAYEQSPPSGDWYTSALLASGLMDVPNYLDNPYTPDIDGGYELFSDNSYESHLKLVDMIPDNYDITWLYDYPYLRGGDWNRSVDTLDHDSLVEAFDEGHSVVAMNGHGWIDGTGLAHYNGSGSTNFWWDWHNAYDYTDADNASNDGMLPWVYIAACYVGDITLKDDRTLERLVMNPEGGAIGMVAGNGENYKGESIANASYGNWFLERHFWRAYFLNGPGFALAHAKTAYLDLVSSDEVPHPPLYDAYYAADYLSHNLLGDPMTQVWTDVPGGLRLASVEDSYSTGLDWVKVKVTDMTGNPVRAYVHASWEGGVDERSTDERGIASIWAPVDAGEITFTITAANHLPLEETVQRPVTSPDVELVSIGWYGSSGEPDGTALLGDELTLSALVQTHGRYSSDLARVEYKVAQGDGDYQRIHPDPFAAVMTGSKEVTRQLWTPSSAGEWRVRVEIDPEERLPNAVASNDLLEMDILVRGPPVWLNPPVAFHVDCTQAPGGSLNLMRYLDDPDTPLEELELSAEAIEEVDGVDIAVRDGRLTVCTQLSRAMVHLRITARDGIYSASFDLLVNLTRDTVPRLRIDGPTLHTLSLGGNVTGTLSIQPMGPGNVDGLLIVALDEHPDLKLSTDGSFSFLANSPGTHAVRLAIQREDGTTEGAWEGALLVFRVAVGSGNAPQPYGWRVVEMAEGQMARVQLQAVDLEGGPVTYSLVDTDGLEATIDPGTGLLTLEPSEVDLGEHTLLVRLSDGVSAEDYNLNVKVTAAPETSSATWVVLAVVIVAAVAVALYLYWRQRLAHQGS